MKNGVKIMGCAVVVAVVTLPVWSEGDKKGVDARPYISINQEDVVNMTDNRTVDLKALVERLSSDIKETGVYRVMNMEDAIKVVKKANQMSVVADDGTRETKIEAPGFFIGLSITTCGLNTVATQNAYMGTFIDTELAKVELILKVVDARTGEMIKSICLAGSAMGQVTGAVSNLREQILQTAMAKVREKIVYELVKLTPFGILDVENGVVSLDVPSSLKIMGKPVQPGTQFTVAKLGRGKRSKRTGKMTYPETQVAVVSVTTVGEDSCSAQILSGAITPIGDNEDTQYDPYIVKINEGAAATPVPAAVAPAAGNAATPF